MDQTAETLLRDLEKSPSDLKKLVVSALWRDRNVIAIEAEAIARWERDDPARWASVQEWLLSRGFTIAVLRSRSTTMPRATPSPPWRQPPQAGIQG
jgi:hypothetical protein